MLVKDQSTVCVCVCACVRACVRASMCEYERERPLARHARIRQIIFFFSFFFHHFWVGYV